MLNIHKYELIYKPLNQTIDFKGGKVTKFNIYDTDYFIGFGMIDTKFSNWNNGEYDCTLIGLDNNNKILIKSKQELQIIGGDHGPGWFSGSWWISIKFNLIDKKNKKYIYIKEWVSSMKQLLISTDFNELYYRRIYYYINFRKNQHRENLPGVDKTDLRRFIMLYNPANNHYHLYSDIIVALKIKLL